MAKKKKMKSAMPKKIAGVKIPKKVRKGAVGQFVASPAGQAMIGEMLLAALAAIRKGGKGSKLGIAARHPAAAAELGASRAADLGSDAMEALRERTASLSEAFGEAARHFMDSVSADADDRGGSWRDEREAASGRERARGHRRAH
ncbi:hypothetical protein [Propylenella binzhouense]|uniref:Uncharacterized protein n=1 Tax=Propylenella binzhouense TaxID=2555902 RepID=A0A964TAV0_9HYPH|nr:hypothetical protein [Propylenella binzhouense]MYZ50457.1 hypothetical protein [Propylenella binzhouense]